MSFFLRSPRPRAAHVLLVLAVGCGGADAIRLTIEPNPDNAVTAVLSLDVDEGVGGIVIAYGDDQSYGRTAPVPELDHGSGATVLLGLTPGATQHVLVAGTKSDGSLVTSGDVTFEAPALGDDVRFPVTSIKTEGTTEGPSATGCLLVVPSLDGTADLGTANTGLMLDRSGRVLWYRKGGGPYGTILERLPNGHFVFFQNGEYVAEELDLAGNIVGMWRAPEGSFRGIQAHEFQLEPDGDHAYVIGSDLKRHVDTSGLDRSPEAADGNVLRNTVLRLTRDRPDESVVVWHASSEIDFVEDRVGCVGSGVFSRLSENDDLVDGDHLNSIEQLDDGMLLVSSRFMSTVYKVDPEARDPGNQIVWRLGGLDSDFEFIGDPLAETNPLQLAVTGRLQHGHLLQSKFGFSCQHDVRASRLPKGNLLLRIVDNGDNRDDAVTRVVEFEIDETARTATFVRSFDLAEFSPIAGSSRITGKRWLVDFAHLDGSVTDLVESDPSGKPTWGLHFDDAWTYRAELVDGAYPFAPP